MKPRELLTFLVLLACAASGWMYGLHWKTVATDGSGDASGVIAEMDEMVTHLEALERENASLRSLAEGGGDVPVAQEMVTFVQEATGYEFTSTVRVQRATGEDLADSVRDELAHVFGGAKMMDELETQWRWIGLISPEQNVWPQLVSLRSRDARGVLGADRILVAADFDPGSIADASALVQLMTEKLMRQNAAVLADDASFDARLAREAVILGMCDKVVSKFRSQQARRFGAIGGTGEVEEEEGEQGYALWALDFARFGFVEGRDYVEREFSQNRSLRDLLENPPQSTREVMLGEEGTGDLGYAVSRSLLRVAIGDGVEVELPDVVGDRLVTFDGESLIWQLDLADANVAETVAEALRELMGLRFVDDPTIPASFRRNWGIEVDGAAVRIENRGL